MLTAFQLFVHPCGAVPKAWESRAASEPAKKQTVMKTRAA